MVGFVGGAIVGGKIGACGGFWGISAGAAIGGIVGLIAGGFIGSVLASLLLLVVKKIKAIKIKIATRFGVAEVAATMG